MGWWNSIGSVLTSTAHDVVHGAEDAGKHLLPGSSLTGIRKGLLHAIDDVDKGAGKAVTAVKSGIIADVRTEFKADTNALHTTVQGVSRVASDLEHGRLNQAATDSEHAVGTAVSDEWNGKLKGSSDLWNGINQGAHDVGSGVANGYTAAVNGTAKSIEQFAGKDAASVFRRVAMGLGNAVGTQSQFGWGVVEGVHDGVYSAVKGIGTLTGDSVKFQLDGSYRDHVTSELEQYANFATKHPLTAYEQLGMLEYHLADKAWQGGVQAAKSGDLAEYLGKGVGQVGVAVGAAVVAPEADAGEAAGDVGELGGAAADEPGALVPMKQSAAEFDPMGNPNGLGTSRQIAGYDVTGTAGLVGSVYNVNIYSVVTHFDAAALDGLDDLDSFSSLVAGKGMPALGNALKAEASAAGAQSISIVGTEIVNSGFMRLARVAGRFGFEFTQINPTTIRLSGPVP